MEGLQIQRFTHDMTDPDGVVEDDGGEYVLFSDYDTLHKSAQNLTAKTLTLTIEKDELAKQRKTLGEALRRYGKHDEDCGAGDGSGVRCNCGLRNVLRDTGEEV